MNKLEAHGRITRLILWAALLSLIVLYGFPFLYLFFTSFKTPLATNAIPPTVLPPSWTTANYVTALHTQGVAHSFLNSIQTAVMSTVLALVLSIPAAYGVTRFRTRLGQA